MTWEGKRELERDLGLKQTIAKHLLNIYVGYLKQRAPKEWSTRQLNFHLFDRTSCAAGLCRDFKVTEGLQLLSRRKSIPRLDPFQVITAGMRRAEVSGQFAHGLRILYHPLASLLLFPGSTFEIYKLLAAFPMSHRMPFLKRNNASLSHQDMRIEAEIDAFTAIVQECSGDAWSHSFLDFKAIALGMYLEARSLCDPARQQAWSQVVTCSPLRFEDWRVGPISHRSALDRILVRCIGSFPLRSPSLEEIQFEYLREHVLPEGYAIHNPRPLKRSEFSAPGFSSDEIHFLRSAVLGVFPD